MIGIVLVAFVGVSPAEAASTVSGERDSNAPLVIDPSGDPVETSLAWDTAAFVQEMPVTKKVSGVTLGDLASGASCATPATARLFVTEHAGGELTTGNQVAYSEAFETLPESPGKVRWTIPPSLFRKGYGYSFNVSPSAACSSGRKVTWAHGGDQVQGGSDGCGAGPPVELSPPGRMWHVQGQSDYQPFCVGSLDPSMPTGWLAVSGGSSGYVLWGSNWSDSQPPPTPETLCGSRGADAGAKVVRWRVTPGFPDNSDYVCMWPQFGAREGDLADGWYFGVPWQSDGVADPRDVYVKLDAVDYSALLEAHRPLLRYNSEEGFHALSPAAATDFYDASDEPDDPAESNRLVDSGGPFALANPFLVAGSASEDQLSLGLLGANYPAGNSRRASTPAAPDDFISLRGNLGVPVDSSGYAADAASMEIQQGYADRTYGHVAYGEDGALWLQYWIYYYYDDQVNLTGSGAHEGDWEMVQIRLDTSDHPDRAAYAQHATGERCDWGEVDSSGGRPIVYVAQGSHASYFRPGHYDTPNPDDNADGQGIEGAPLVDQIRSDNPSWVGWPGKWGDSGDAPDGPAFKGQQWTDPSGWANGLADCDAN